MRKTALITGGNRGIGKGCAITLAREGYRVCIAGRDNNTLQDTLKEIQELSPECTAIQCDVRKNDEQMKMFGHVQKTYGRLDVCIPNAGVATLACATETTLEQWNRDIETNLTGLYITATEALKIMKEQQAGAIIGVVSKSGKKAFYLRAAYCASKWGALGFLKCLALEGKNYNVKVTALCPGSVATDFQKENPAGTDWMMSAEEVARAVKYILSLEQNAYIDELVMNTWKRT